MLTKIVLAAALVIGPVSATLASDTGAKAAAHARASYAQAHVQKSSKADSNASTDATSRPQTSFEKNWFGYQDQDQD
jgi:hypothetical protein